MKEKMTKRSLIRLRWMIDEYEVENNSQPVFQFDNYSPVEMYSILSNSFGQGCPIQLKQMEDEDYARVPLLTQVKYLTNLIRGKGEIKLTGTGALPLWVVADLFRQGFINDKYMFMAKPVPYREADSMNIQLIKLIILFGGLATIKKDKLRLTDKGERLLSDNYELLKLIFLTFGMDLNWSFFDFFGQHEVGQFGFGYSLILLGKYGYKKNIDDFYGLKYFEAFPVLLEYFKDNGTTGAQGKAYPCYSARTFLHFMEFFGIIDITAKDWVFIDNIYVMKTDLFDKLFEIFPHRA